MADWEYKPQVGYAIDSAGPATLVDYAEDQSPFIREKSSTEKRIFAGSFSVSVATAKAMLDVWDTKKNSTSFTMITYDPQATTPSADVATVYFVGKKPNRRWRSSSLIVLDFVMREA